MFYFYACVCVDMWVCSYEIRIVSWNNYGSSDFMHAFFTENNNNKYMKCRERRQRCFTVSQIWTQSHQYKHPTAKSLADHLRAFASFLPPILTYLITLGERQTTTGGFLNITVILEWTYRTIHNWFTSEWFRRNEMVKTLSVSIYANLF